MYRLPDRLPLTVPPSDFITYYAPWGRINSDLFSTSSRGVKWWMVMPIDSFCLSEAMK